MNYFLKTISDRKDPAISGEQIDSRCMPFVILCLDGFADPPFAEEALFIAEIMAAFTGPGDAIAVCRVAYEKENHFGKEISQFSSTWPFEIDWGLLRGRSTEVVHFIGSGNRTQLAHLLRKYWNTKAGHWTFCGCPHQEMVCEQVKSTFVKCGRHVGRLRDYLIGQCSFAGVTFDDNMLDLFVKMEEERVRETIQSIAADTGVDLQP